MFVIKMVRQFYNQKPIFNLYLDPEKLVAMRFETRQLAAETILKIEREPYMLVYDEVERPYYKIIDIADVPDYLNCEL